ncbi:hypothetical protein SEA_STEAMY_2 [Mycobacterium phage Steamy]|uniref:Peptidase n=1 Tax=Mycobacterium phage Steamy TaxID=2250309 RepID=A0A345L0H7_9CAUD|nr:peptidase [Mycobacterium phage Steamy]AXH48779.1 hypothetical protein SEA_STEAMY_2 [Mycobacterium phage Steamy]
MGGRGPRGGTGPGIGKAKARKAKGGAGAGSSGSSGGGGSAGSSSGSGKGNSGAGTGGVATGGGSAGGMGGGGSTGSVNQQQHTRVEIEFGGNLTATEQAIEQKYLDQLPEHISKRLAERGTRLFVGGRADQSPGWALTGLKPDDKSGDGRELGDLSFYMPGINAVYISSRSPHGSANVYVHELGHAVDYQWIRGGRTVTFAGKDYHVRLISDDPFFRAMHKKYIRDNEGVDPYYRTGSYGNESSGRRESVAEGLAVYNRYGRDGLVKLFNSQEAATLWIKIMQRYGVIK